MTVYDGEFTQLRITAQIERAPGAFEPLTGDDVDAAAVTIWDAAGAKVVDAEALTWDEAFGLWTYPWNTFGLGPGYYQTRALFTGPGTFRSWEYGRVRLAADRAPVEPAP